MAIELNHTIVPSRDKTAAAAWFAKILGLPLDKQAVGRFAPVRVNHSLTLDFADAGTVDTQHYAFKVSEAEFDAIFGRIQAEGIPYGSGPPNAFDDMQINHRDGGRGVYFRDPDGHILELLTVG